MIFLVCINFKLNGSYLFNWPLGGEGGIIEFFDIG